MFRRLSQLVSGIVMMACTVPLGTPANAQSLRREGRIAAREDRQAARNGAGTYGNNAEIIEEPLYAEPGYYGPNDAGPVERYPGPAYASRRGALYGPRSYLGIRMSESPEGHVGVTYVYPLSPAAQAGLRPGDIILAIDGREVFAARAVSQMVAMHYPGETMEFQIDRQGREDRLEAVLAAKSAASFAAGAPVTFGPRPDLSIQGSDLEVLPPRVAVPGYGRPAYVPTVPLQVRRPRSEYLDPFSIYNGYPLY